MAEIKTVRTSGIVPHVPIIEPLEATHNGLYVAPSGIDGYSPVNVQVQEQPWQPLEDGYSNFWFELTNDTLSPWLNFSAKNNDAVIDWGDGSGEQSLDTLTPTHTYSKAGKYVVKVKGVTGIARQHNSPYTAYANTLRSMELASEVDAFSAAAFADNHNLENVVVYGNVNNAGGSAFTFCTALQNVDISSFTELSSSLFYYCTSLMSVVLPNVPNIPTYAFYQCRQLSEITIPSTVTGIEASAFASAMSLSVMHIQATTPPTLGANAFSGLPTGWICYVPVGYGDTYKAAAGWSAYSDHILEEGETPNT